MMVAMVLHFNVPTPEDVPEIIMKMNLPNLPFFAGDLNVVVEPHYTELKEWLHAPAD